MRISDCYSLSFGGGATMVLTARSTGTPVKYVTIVAQPDFYGQPKVLLKQVTSDAQLWISHRVTGWWTPWIPRAMGART